MLELYRFLRDQQRLRAGQESLLRPSAGVPVPTPWFRDGTKLLRAVLDRARGDRAFALMVVEAVGRLARDDATLRDALRAAAKSDRRGPRGTPYWQDVLLVKELDMIRGTEKRSFESACEWLAERYSMEPESMRNRVSKALARVTPADRGSFDWKNGVTD